MLFKLSLKNIVKSIKDYAIYFFTLVLGVAIFYVFNANESQTVMMKVSDNTAEIISLMTNVLSGVSVFVSFVLGFLIIYASRFLIKRRNREFGIYLTLGMGKRKISFILFIETLAIGMISLATGLIVGAGLSQLMSIFVANMFEADMTKFKFVFSLSACIKTLVYFGIIYILVMLFNTIIIGRCKLIDLINGNRKSEKVTMKNPIVCIFVFIISMAFIGYGYYGVMGGYSNLDDQMLFKVIFAGSVGTLFLFWSLSGLILKIVMSVKKVYYKDLNSFVLRQISSKINTTVVQITIICLMLFVTICIFSSALSIKTSMDNNIKELVPVDIQLSKNVNSDFSDNKKIAKDNKISIENTLTNNGFDYKTNFKDIVKFNTYEADKFTIKDTLGDSYKQVAEQYKFLAVDNNEVIMKLSDYNKIAKQYGHTTYELKDDQYMIIANFVNMMEIRNIALRNGEKITINGKDYSPKFNQCKTGFVEISGSVSETGVFILPDKAVENLELHQIWLNANYNASTKEQRQKVENEINKLIEKTWLKTSIMTVNTKNDIEQSCIGLSAMVTFIGLYLGIIFLISSAAILALKELSESTDNRERYVMLRKLGADEKMLNKALFKQIGLFFGFPLFIAIIHSIVGIKFCNTILLSIGRTGLLPSIIMTGAFLVVIYGGYFVITYWCSKNIIK